jgi:hypothetical protein
MGGKIMGKKSLIKQEDVSNILNNCYEAAQKGIGKVSPPIEQFAEDYLCKSKTPEAAKSMLNNQITKCATSGFLTGFGGLITLPITIPANVGSILYVQRGLMRCL